MEKNLDLERVRELAEELDGAVPREGAWLREGESEEAGTLITANRAGYLRLGIELLKSALTETPGEADPSRVDPVEVDLDYLAGQEVCYQFQRREQPPADSEAPALGTGGAVLAVSLTLLFFATLVVGLVTIARWLFGLFF